MERMQGLLQGRPLILDRGFHSRAFFTWLQQRGLPFIVRVRIGGQGRDLRDARGERLRPVVAPGQRRVWREVQYHELRSLTLIGYWVSSHAAPIGLLTTWPNPEQALAWYLMRMRIEEAFRDGKTLLLVEANMNQRWPGMSRTMGRVVLAYAMGMVAGELLRDLYGGEGLPEDWAAWRRPKRRGFAYSGLLTLLRIKDQPPPS